MDGRGNTYVNGVGFDLMAGEEFAPGIIALVTHDGSARQVADGMAFPNGMAVTPDNSTLIVAESYAKRLTACDIDTGGGLSNRRVWVDLDGGVPDGICIDAEGAVCRRTSPTNAACASTKAVRCCKRSSSTAAASPAHSAARTAPRLFVMAAQWRGPANTLDEPRTGQVLAAQAPEPGAGWP